MKGAVRVGVVGVGRFGQQHLAAYRQLDRAEIVGIVDANPEVADGAAALLGVEAFRSVAAMLQRARPRAVSVVVPAARRGEMVDEIATTGAAVLVEKPLASNAPAASRLAERWAGRPVMAGHILRFVAPYRRLVAELGERRHQGALSGRLSRIRGRDHLQMYRSEDAVGLTLVHDIDAALWLSAARVTSVTATGHRTPDGRWYEVDAQLVMSNGGTWTVRASWTGAPEDRAAAGDVALVIAQDHSALLSSDTQIATWLGAEAVYGDALRAELDHFLECAVDDTPSDVLALADATATVAVVDAVRKSLDNGGGPVELT